MADIYRTIMDGAKGMNAGDLDAIVARYRLPFVLCIDNQNTVVETDDHFAQLLSEWQQSMLAHHVVRTDTKIVSQFVTDDDMAFVVTDTKLVNAEARVVRRKTLSYVLRCIEGAWKIVVLSCNERAAVDTRSDAQFELSA